MADQQYLCEGYSNVYIVRDENHVKPNSVFKVHHYTKPLIDALLLKRPNWTFKARRVHNYHADELIAASFDVWCNGEMLGDISASSTTRTGEVKTDYMYDTHRLREDRQRGGWSKTTKLDVAVKNILKTFYSKTISERVEDAHQHVQGKLRQNTAKESNAFHMKSRLVNAGITNFVMDNWEELAPRMRAAGVNLSDEMPTLFARLRDVENVERSYSEQLGYVVVLRGSDYVLSCCGDDNSPEGVMIKSSEQLPPTVRRNLGLLKLSQPGETISNIGLRIDDYTYFVMGGVNND